MDGSDDMGESLAESHTRFNQQITSQSKFFTDALIICKLSVNYFCHRNLIIIMCIFVPERFHFRCNVHDNCMKYVVLHLKTFAMIFTMICFTGHNLQGE